MGKNAIAEMVPKQTNPTLTNMFKAARAQDYEIAELKAQLEAKDALIAHLSEEKAVLMIQLAELRQAKAN